jgi:hypothetical protein
MESIRDQVSELCAKHRERNTSGPIKTLDQFRRIYRMKIDSAPKEDELERFVEFLWNQNNKFKTEKTEILKADMQERLRFLAFRIATAVGIALVVLGTGAMAKCLEIPLPLLRIAS